MIGVKNINKNINKKIGLIENNRKSILPFVKKFLLAIQVPFVVIEKSIPINDKINYIINSTNNIGGLYFTNGNDKQDQIIIKLLKKKRYKGFYLFSELGWLTYQRCFYLDHMGIGNYNSMFKRTFSSIYKKPEIDIINRYKKDLDEELNKFQKSVPYDNYILAPLQVDGDSKLIIGSPHFKTVSDFVDHIINLVPNTYIILFKNHPKNKHPAPIPKLPNVIDITHEKYNKKQLIEKAFLIVGINSTFLLESLYLHKKVCSFGLDVFSNKDLVIDGFGKTFDEIINTIPTNLAKVDRFINELFLRQIYFHGNDDYYKNHFWSLRIKKLLSISHIQ